jgi:GNAT superfamily N-acetyltransferase
MSATMEPSASPAEVRLARPADARALTRLVTELGYPGTVEEVAARLGALQAAGEIVLVAARAGEAIGVLTLHVTPVLHRPRPVGRLTLLVVGAELRGLGVGRALVAEGERLLAARGCGMVEVTSNQRRTEAHAFYQRLGYEITSLRLYKTLVPPA